MFPTFFVTIPDTERARTELMTMTKIVFKANFSEIFAFFVKYKKSRTVQRKRVKGSTALFPPSSHPPTTLLRSVNKIQSKLTDTHKRISVIVLKQY
jgi:hypothetical protein